MTTLPTHEMRIVQVSNVSNASEYMLYSVGFNARALHTNGSRPRVSLGRLRDVVLPESFDDMTTKTPMKGEALLGSGDWYFNPNVGRRSIDSLADSVLTRPLVSIDSTTILLSKT